MGKESTTRYVNDYLNLISDCGVISNSVLKRGNYGVFARGGICFWSFRTSCFYPSRKINKNFKRKRDPRRGIQRGLMHCSKTRRYR